MTRRQKRREKFESHPILLNELSREIASLRMKSPVSNGSSQFGKLTSTQRPIRRE